MRADDALLRQPIGTDWEEVGFGVNKGVVQGLLREKLGFDGIVCTDWGLISDAEIFGETHQARAWGLESLTELQRAARVWTRAATSSAARTVRT